MFCLPDHVLPPAAEVCIGHLSPECFSNLMEVNLGSSKVLMLKNNAVPNAAVPVPITGLTSPQQPLLLVSNIEVSIKYVCNIHRLSLSGYAVSHVTWLLVSDPQPPSLMFQPSRLCKRARNEVSADDSSYQLDVTNHELYKVKDLVHKTASVSII